MRIKQRWIGWGVLALWLIVGGWQVFKPMPAGTDMNTPPLAVAASDVRFLNDLSYADPRGRPVREQAIFDEVFAIIDDAESFIVADFFLFNEQMVRRARCIGH